MQATQTQAAGDMAHSSLARALDILIDKRLVAAEVPLWMRPSRERRYRIADPYLRFWLAFIQPNRALIERRRGDLALARIRESWTSWRGRAVEPLIRESLARLLPVRGLPDAAAVGGYWTRANDVEIDVVGADREPVARKVLFLGSIKWLEESPFDLRDLTALQRARGYVTADPVPLLAVSRSGFACAGLDAMLGPDDLLRAWNGGAAG